MLQLNFCSAPFLARVAIFSRSNSNKKRSAAEVEFAARLKTSSTTLNFPVRDQDKISRCMFVQLNHRAVSQESYLHTTLHVL